MTDSPQDGARCAPAAPSPDWDKWGAFAVATIPQLVALTCDLDPDHVAVGWLANFYLHGDEEIAVQYDEVVYGTAASDQLERYEALIPSALLRTLYARLAIARSHVQGGQLATLSGGFDGGVRVGTFASWAESVGWTLHSRFPRIASPAPSGPTDPRPAKAQELSTKERTSLLVVIYAVAKMANLDLDHPTTAAKAVVKWLDEDGRRIGQRTVEDILKKAPEAAQDKNY